MSTEGCIRNSTVETPVKKKNKPNQTKPDQTPPPKEKKQQQQQQNPK